MLTRHSNLRHLPEISGLILVLISALSIWTAWKREEQNNWVTHTLEVQNAIYTIDNALVSAQSANRGFILTGDESFLEPFERAVKLLPDKFSRLATLISDNAEQVASLKSLQSSADIRLAALGQSNDLRRTKGQQAALDFIVGNSAGQPLQNLRATIEAMKDRETSLLVQRRAAAARTDWYQALLSGLGIVIVLAISGVWIASARRYTRQLQDTIAEREAAEAQVRQMQKMEAIGQLTGGIAHDFNNMLAVIISALGLVKKRVAAGNMDIGRLVDSAVDGANRAATLTKRLTAFSRQSTLDPQPVNCNKFVATMSDLISRSLGATVKIETVLGGGLWLTNVDASQLENALLNLAVNARDAMPEGGNLTIETSNAFLDERYGRANAIAPGQYVQISLTDNGSGMSPDIVARAFDPFFTTKAVGKGTGLGLSQVHGFVRQSGGHVKIYSEPGQGTTIKIYLPRYYGNERKTNSEPVLHKPAQYDPSAYTILVVEDDDSVRAATIALVQDMGFKVLEAENADAALQVIDARPDIDILFTDIVMPGRNGRKLADEAIVRRPALRVLFTTGFTRNAIVHHGVLDAGVDYIAKPFSMTELAHKLEPIVLDLKRVPQTQS